MFGFKNFDETLLYDFTGYWLVNKRFLLQLIFQNHFDVQIVKILQHIP